MLDGLSPQAPLLAFRQVSKLFGGVAALNDVSFEVQQGEILGIIGPNGAGKSTALSLIAGSQGCTFGEILFDGRSLKQFPPHAIPRLGIGRARQVPRPFGRMTVRQNILVPAHSHQRKTTESEHHTQEILEVCGLQNKAQQVAGSLMLLDLKRLEVARALALRPRLLLLDEVAAGLVGYEADEITQLIASIHASGITIMLVEHVQAVIQQLAKRVIVLDWGRKIAEGTPKQIAKDPKVVAVYLGTDQSGSSALPAAALQQDESLHPLFPENQPEPSLLSEVISHIQQTEHPHPLLYLEKVNVDYGKFRAVRSVDLEVRADEIVAILGANGAGKTTLTRAVCGLIPTSGGKMLFNEKDITKYPAHRRARLGIALCHEGRRLFKDLTVRENIELGIAYASHTLTPAEERLARVYELFPALKEKITTLAGKLSGGQQQMVAIARALVSEPELLLLDELSLGLAPKIIDQLFEVLPQIRGWGTSIVLIEQHVHRSLAIADRVYILERGQISFSGTPATLRQDETLSLAYFGDATDRSRRLSL
jgi:branched-chain amino acid transport system ATP-binding protein